jgi:HSP20 family protein
MTNIARYDPFDLFEGMVKSVLRPGFDAAVEARRNTLAAWIPLDVVENDTSYLVWADLPGISKEDVSVSIAGNQVSLTAERKLERAVDQGQGREAIVLNERPFGTLSRQIQFAAEIDDGKAQAAYRDGVLQLTLPKKESAQVKRLEIH